MALTQRALMVLLTACSAVAGCSGSTMNGVSAGIGLTDSNDGKSKSAPDSDSERAKANAPQQVSGSFLTCAYMSSEKEILAAAKANQPLEFGCGLYHRVGTALTLTDISGLDIGTGIRCPSARVQKAPSAALARSANLHFKIEVQPDQLPCTIAMALSGTDRAVVAFGRSIPTITQLDANHGFTAIKDVQASGMTFASDGTPRYPSSPSLALFDQVVKEFDSSAQAYINKLLKQAPLVSGGKVPAPDSSEDTTPIVSYTDNSPAGVAARKKVSGSASDGSANANGGSQSKYVGNNPGNSNSNSNSNGNSGVAAPASATAAKPGPNNASSDSNGADAANGVSTSPANTASPAASKPPTTVPGIVPPSSAAGSAGSNGPK